MRRWLPLLVVVLVCLPAVWPYLGGDLPRSNDTLTHLYRAVELDRLIRSGDLFPRWGPDFAHGYGYPIFNYFAYFSHYLIVLFHFTGLSLLASVRAAYVAAGLGAGLTAYWLGKALAEDANRPAAAVPAGLTACAAYVYSPYLLYTVNVRGGLPEALALAFLPLALWGVRASLIRADRPSRPVLSDGIAAAAIAGFIASHVGMAIQYLPLIGLWGLYCLLAGARPRSRREWFALWPRALALGGILCLGLGLTAFLWLPSVVELRYVQFESAFAAAGLVYTANFLHLTDLFAYPAVPVSTALLNPPVIRALSLPALAVAAAGLAAWRRAASSRRADLLFLWAGALACLFLSLDLSRPIWDLVGLLQRSTFPWRFLGPASLLIALLAGLAVAALDLPLGAWRLDPGRAALIVTPLLAVAAVPFMFPPREPAPENPGPADLARYEIPPLLVATTTTGEYTPIWVEQFPDTHDQQAALSAGRQPDRLAAPAAGSAAHTLAAPAHDDYHLSLPSAQTLTYRSFYFPGWRAALDGQPLAVHPSSPDGLIAFDVPAGEHDLDIRFGDTPVRTAADWLSAASLAALAAGLVLAAQGRAVVQPASDAARPGWGFGLGLAALTLAAWALAAWALIRPGPPPLDHVLNLDYGGELTLIGYSLGRDSTITLAWQAQHPLGVPYGFNVRLTDERGLVLSDTNIDRPADWRFYPGTDFWPAGQVILDSYILKPLTGTPPAVYHLDVIAYRLSDKQALADQVIGDYTLAAPSRAALGAQTVLWTDGGAGLVRFAGDRAEAAPGDPYRLSLQWQAQADAPAGGALVLDLVDAAGTAVYSRAEALSPAYPPARWKAGDLLNQDFVFRLPAGLPGGSFRWRINGALLPAAPALAVHVPARSFSPPALAHPQGADFGPLRLLGWNGTAASGTLTVDLVWQAAREMETPYRVFLHLLDSSGALVSQSDGEPVNWTRPTTGWLAGEVVVDSRQLAVPGPGVYSLETGLVDAAGNRLGEPAVLGPLQSP